MSRSKADRFANLRKATPPEQIEGTRENARLLIQHAAEMDPSNDAAESTQDQPVPETSPGKGTGKNGGSILAQFEKDQEEYDKHTLLLRKEISTELEALCKGKKRGFKTAFVNYAIEQALKQVKEEGMVKKD